MKCVSCESVDTKTVAGVWMCRSCFLHGRGFAHIYEAVIVGCRAFGVTLQVWQTGGGCMSMAVADDIGGWREVLFGQLDGDLATDELTVDVYADDYEGRTSEQLTAKFPAPEVRTVPSVVEWIVSVVRSLRSVDRVPDDAYEWFHVADFQLGDDVSVQVDTNSIGQCRVGWFPNHLVGSEGEVFPSLACGLARVAALAECGEDGGFAHPDEVEFATHYRDFVAPRFVNGGAS